MEITRKKAAELLKKSKGKIFGVTFVKKDGSIRPMTARLGVWSHTKGGELAYDPDDYGLIGVFDMQKGDYRMVNVKTILEVRTGGEVYRVTK